MEDFFFSTILISKVKSLPLKIWACGPSFSNFTLTVGTLLGFIRNCTSVEHGTDWLLICNQPKWGSVSWAYSLSVWWHCSISVVHCQVSYKASSYYASLIKYQAFTCITFFFIWLGWCSQFITHLYVLGEDSNYNLSTVWMEYNLRRK